MLIRGWFGLVLRRAAADRALVASAALVVLVASAVLVAAAGYPAMAARQGAVTRLLAADRIATAISVTFDAPPASVADADAKVRKTLAEAMATTGGEIVASGRSESYDPGLGGGEYAPLTKFAFVDGLEGHARLAEGSWPTGGRPELEAVVTRAAADRLEVGVGSTLTMAARLNPRHRLTIRIVGVLAPDDPGDPVWGRDPLVLDGVVKSGPFTTVGPVFVTRGDLLDRTVVTAATLTWRALPDFARLEIRAVPAVAAAAAGVGDRVRARIGGDRSVSVETDLPAILGDVNASLGQADAGSGLVGGQLLVLALYALVFVAALVVERRRGSTLLLQARGATALAQLRLAVLEAAVVSVPVAGIGLLLGAGIVRLLAGGATPTAGDTPALAVTESMLVAAAGTGAAAMAGLVAPVVTSTGSIARFRRSAAGRRGGAILSRSGVDLALVALAGLAVWQLRSAPPGTRGLDPVDLAAPAIGLAAGALLSLRLTPLLARAVERALSRGTVSLALAGRGVARNADAYARPVLLLVVATAIAVYCVEFDRTWTGSQRDQVAHDVAADVRGTAAVSDRRPLREAAQAFLGIPGVTAASPVIRETFDLGPDLSAGRLIALPSDPALADGAARPDLADRPLSELLAGLAAARPELPLLPAPQAAVRMRVTLDASFAPASGTDPLPAERNGLALAVVVEDASGAMSRLAATPASQAATAAFVVPLRATEADGVAPATTRPLSVVAVELDVTPPPGPGLVGTVTVTAIETSASQTGDADWRPIDLAPTRGQWTFSRTAFGTAAEPLPADPRLPGRAVIAADDPVTGLGATTIAFRPQALDGLDRTPMAAVVDQRALAAGRASVGDTVLAQHGFSGTRGLTITGVVSSFPGVSGTGLAVVDLGTLQAATYGAEGTLLPASEWWLATDGPDDRVIATTVAAPPFVLADVRTRRLETQARLDDPVAVGLFGTFRLAAVAAVVLAALGLVAAAWAAGRARRGEFTVLRALGLRRRELATWLVVEQAFPILTGLGGGVLLGVVLGVLVLPATTRAPDGAAPVPPAVVAVPWDIIAVIALAGAVAVAATSLLALRGIEAVGAAETLRGGTAASDA